MKQSFYVYNNGDLKRKDNTLPGEAEATRFAADLNTLGIPAAVFPARDYVLRPIEGTAREYEYRRLAVLGELVGGRLRAVAVPAEELPPDPQWLRR